MVSTADEIFINKRPPSSSDVETMVAVAKTGVYRGVARETAGRFPQIFAAIKKEVDEGKEINVNKYTNPRYEEDIGSKDKVKENVSVADQSIPVDNQMVDLALGTEGASTLNQFSVGTIPAMTDIDSSLKYNYGASTKNLPISTGNSVDNGTGFNNSSIPNTAKNKNLFDRYKNKLQSMGLKSKSFDPATGESLGLKDTDPMRAVVKPMLAAIMGGAALPGVAISWISHGRAQQKAATEMIKDIEDGTFRQDKMYLNYSGKQLFRKMATTFADPYQQMNTIYGKAGVDGSAIRNFFDYAADNDMFDKKTLRDLQKYRPGLLASTLSAYDAAGKERPDITFYASEFKETLPQGSELFSTVEMGGQTVQQTYQTPTGQTVSTGVQSDGIQQQPSQPDSNQQGSANQGGGGNVVIGEQTIQSGNTPAFSGNPFIGRATGGPIPVGNTEVVNEPNKDMSGVADDIPRQLQEGDFVINAPAVSMAGKADILKMIKNARDSLRARGIQLTGREAGDIDVDISNKEIVISKAEAEEIGYDRLEKINNRGKERVREIQEEREQIQQNPQPQGMMNVQNAQVGGQIALDENKNQPIAVPRETFAGQSSVGSKLLSPMSPQAQDDEKELSDRSQSFEGFMKPIQMQEGDKIQIKKKPILSNKDFVYKALSNQQRVQEGEGFYKLRPEAIAGIMGNIDVETGGTYDYKTQQIGGSAQGLFQFEKPHMDAYNQYKKDRGITPSASAQVEYVIDNIFSGVGLDIGAKNRTELIGSLANDSTEEITKKFSNLFLRPGKPNINKRIEKAQSIYEEIFGTQKLNSGDRVKPQEVARDLIAKEIKEELVQNMSSKQQKITTGFLAVADTVSKIASDKILSGEFDMMGGKLKIGANPSASQGYLGFSKTF